MTGNMWLIGPTVTVFTRILYSEARLTRAQNTGSALVFRFPPMARLLFGFVLIALSVLLVTDFGNDSLWVMVGGMAMLIWLALSWPATITIDSLGVSRNLWWKPKRCIPWERVVGVDKNLAGDLHVYGSAGESIEFTRFHVDPQRFESEVIKRAKLKGATDARAPVALPHV